LVPVFFGELCRAVGDGSLQVEDHHVVVEHLGPMLWSLLLAYLITEHL
jgi:hypothetical protein